MSSAPRLARSLLLAGIGVDGLIEALGSPADAERMKASQALALCADQVKRRRTKKIVSYLAAPKLQAQVVDSVVSVAKRISKSTARKILDGLIDGDQGVRICVMKGLWRVSECMTDVDVQRIDSNLRRSTAAWHRATGVLVHHSGNHRERLAAVVAAGDMADRVDDTTLDFIIETLVSLDGSLLETPRTLQLLAKRFTTTHVEKLVDRMCRNDGERLPPYLVERMIAPEKVSGEDVARICQLLEREEKWQGERCAIIDLLEKTDGVGGTQGVTWPEGRRIPRPEIDPITLEDVIGWEQGEY